MVDEDHLEFIAALLRQHGVHAQVYDKGQLAHMFVRTDDLTIAVLHKVSWNSDHPPSRSWTIDVAGFEIARIEGTPSSQIHDLKSPGEVVSLILKLVGG